MQMVAVKEGEQPGERTAEAGDCPNLADRRSDLAAFRAGFERVEHDMGELAPTDLEVVNLDVPRVVATVLGVWPGVLELRAGVASLPAFDLARFERIRDYALALGYWHTRHVAAAKRMADLRPRAEELMRLRNILHADALALTKRQLLQREEVQRLRIGKGYQNLTTEVRGLVDLFRTRWKEVAGRSATQKNELEFASRLADDLISALQQREEGLVVLAEAALCRQRAFTLLIRAYDDARRAVTYLRWHSGDVDRIAPSLFAGRAPRRERRSSRHARATVRGDSTKQASGSSTRE